MLLHRDRRSRGDTMLCWYLQRGPGSRYRPVSAITGCIRVTALEIAVGLSTTASSCLQPTSLCWTTWPHWTVHP
jgi:hypothetical protein